MLLISLYFFHLKLRKSIEDANAGILPMHNNASEAQQLLLNSNLVKVETNNSEGTKVVNENSITPINDNNENVLEKV